MSRRLDDEQNGKDAEFSSSPYRLPDLSEGKPGAINPLKAYSWQELRGIIYGETEETKKKNTP